MYYGMGYTKNEFGKPMIGVANSHRGLRVDFDDVKEKCRRDRRG